MMNPYDVLGVDIEATLEEIKAAYRKCAKATHPDTHPNDPEAVSKFQQVNEAYTTLSDPEKRARFDDFGAADLDEAGELDRNALELILELFNQAVDAGEVDNPRLLASIAHSIRVAKGKYIGHIDSTEKQIERLNKLAKRWRRKSNGSNFFANALTRRARTLKDGIQVQRDTLTLSDRALQLIEEYEYNVGEAPAHFLSFVNLTLRGTGSTSSGGLG